MTPESKLPLVFVCVPLATGAAHPITERCLKLFDSVDHGLPYRFVLRRFSFYSAPFSTNLGIAMARKLGASIFLRIDGDMNFGPAQVERILGLEERCVGGIYPKKELSLAGQKWVATFIDEDANEKGLRRVLEIGAGFLKVDMSLIEYLITRHPEERFIVDQPIQWHEAEGIAIGDEAFNLFGERVVTDDWRKDGERYPRWLSDDFSFCRRVMDAGEEVWADCACQVGHIGTVDFLAVMAVMQKLMPRDEVEGAVRAMLPGE